MRTNAPPHMVEKAVLAVLAGRPLHQAAAETPMETADLTDAVELYKAAGAAALEAQARARDWFQVHIEFADWDATEQIAATHLGPGMEQVEASGAVSSWWFIRKAQCWRLRCRTGSGREPEEVRAALMQLLDPMLRQGLIVDWRETIYEPEAYAFGGPKGVEAVHRLFHADSRGILDYLSRTRSTTQPESVIGRKELSVLLCSALMRSAGQDWFEQGDIWNRVSELRPLPPGTPLERVRDMQPGLRKLMTVDAGPTTALVGPDGPLAFASAWFAVSGEVGWILAQLAQGGHLSRGVRDVLAHHVIFHANRMGLSGTTQAILARAASGAVFNQ
jgi:thiopeptide-type bacteriocin biosynthesis protein